MDVAVTELRAHLSSWLDRVRGGDEIVVTDRGLPVARLVAVDSSPLLERLTERGVIARPTTLVRPTATGRPRVRATESVGRLISDQRN